METEILRDIPFKIELDPLFKALHIDKNSEDEDSFLRLLDSVKPVISPKAVFTVAYINARQNDAIDLGTVRFTSKVMSKNLEKIERVFPYIASCGSEVDGMKVPKNDFLSGYWLDSIKSAALDTANNYLMEHLKRKYALGHIVSMNPGSGPRELWPIEQQKELFSIFGDVESLIGVRLTESFLMMPNKTISGIYFPSESTYEACKLCQRGSCPGRRSKYDAAMKNNYQ